MLKFKVIFMSHRYFQKQTRKVDVLSRELGIKSDDEIPKKLLDLIFNSKIGIRVKNPTKTGRPEVLVTKKLKKRVAAAL